MAERYEAEAVSRGDIDSMAGAVVLDFGTNWCGHCQAAAPAIEEALADAPSVQHIKVEDGKGRPLGRSFQVKLWPTLIFLKDGVEVDRLVRPMSVDEIRGGLKRIS
jgi:thioredoxin 1